MSLSDHLAALTAPGTNTAQVQSPAPTGWAPGVVYQPDGTRIVTSGPIPETEDPTPVLAAMGITVPEGFRARLAAVTHDPAAWTRAAQGEDAVTVPVVRCRWVIEPAPASIDVDDLLRSVRKRKTAPAKADGTATFVFSCGDLQIGKSDGDGSAGTVQRFYDSLDRSVTRYKALRKRGLAGPVLLGFVGDCPEGTQSQGGRLMARLDLTLTEQIRVLRRIFADEVTAFAELTDDLHVAACAGNHGEATRVGDQMATRYDDSWDIEALAQVADVMAAKGYDQIKWTFPGRDELHVTVEASGSRVGLLHGHQTRGKIQPWLATKAMDRDPIGTADIVLSGHFHSLKIEQLGQLTHMRSGALDGGSVWWTHKGGLSSPPAALTFVTEAGKWHALEVV